MIGTLFATEHLSKASICRMKISLFLIDNLFQSFSLKLLLMMSKNTTLSLKIVEVLFNQVHNDTCEFYVRKISTIICKLY